ncbi:hypothetical protein Tco_0575051 [Tanacetum coccineum]
MVNMWPEYEECSFFTPGDAMCSTKSLETYKDFWPIESSVFVREWCRWRAVRVIVRWSLGLMCRDAVTKASILGKPPLQPSRNHLVVRQPNAFTSERPRISRPRFASQVDEKNDLSKTVTPHYLPKVRESAAAKPHQVNAPNYSRNSHKESYGSNDMVHAYFLEDARKMTQDKTRIPNHRDMASTRAHCTPNACTPKPRNIYRSSPVSKCSGGMSNGEPLVDHSRNSSFFLDSKKFVCSICHKYIFNTNHDDCITKILNKVNSRAKVQSPKIRNNNPVEPKNHTHKPGRQNGIGQRFSLNKSSAVHEKPHTPRSCLRWKPTGRIFKTVSLRWIPTGKVFIDSTTKVDSEPPNGSNDDITNPYECNQTLYVSAGTSNSSAVQASFFILMSFGQNSSGLVLHLDVVWTKQFKPRSSSKDVWTKQFRPRLVLHLDDGRHEHDLEPDFKFIALKEVCTAEPDISTANVSVSTAGAEVSIASPEVKTAAESLVYIRRSAPKRKDKGKAIMKEAEHVQKKTKLQLEQERLGLLVKMINERNRLSTQQRAKQRRNKPITQAQQRTYMCNYIKHMGSHTLQQLKRLSFDELKALFETTMRKVQTFHPIESEGDKTVPELTTGSSKRVAEVELDHEGSKKQKTNEA